jgi:hypothetical protein
MTFRAFSRHLLLTSLIASGTSSMALGRQDPPRAGVQATKTSPQELLQDWIHYTMIAHVELANAKAQALIDSGATNAELASMLDEIKDVEKRFQEAVDRAMMVPQMEPMAAELWKRAEAGRLDLARDPKRIDEAVKMLGTTIRGRQIGEARLLAAKEYAVPALLKEITDGTDQMLKLECQKVLVKLGPNAVAPLSVAVLNLTGANQRLVCDLLGTIKNPTSAPYLREVSETAADQEVKGAARGSISTATSRWWPTRMSRTITSGASTVSPA